MWVFNWTDTSHEGLATQAPGPGNKTFLVVFSTPTLTLVGKHPSSPSQHKSPPPMRDNNPVPHPEDTGSFWVDFGGVATNHSPPSNGTSPTAQESPFSLPL